MAIAKPSQREDCTGRFLFQFEMGFNSLDGIQNLQMENESTCITL